MKSEVTNDKTVYCVGQLLNVTVQLARLIGRLCAVLDSY